MAPAYWIVTSDVLRARARLNFSELGEAPTERQTAALLEALDQMRTGAMPPAAYRMVHPEARVGPKALATLERYLESLPPAGPTS